MWLLWVALALGLLAVVAVGLSAYGAKRWADSTLMLTRGARCGPSRNEARSPPPTRYDARELEGLPAPVQRYFRAVLKDGQPIITAATIDIAGTFNMSADRRAVEAVHLAATGRHPSPGLPVGRPDRDAAGLDGARGRQLHRRQGPAARGDSGLVHRGRRPRWRRDCPRRIHALLRRSARGTRPRCCPARACAGRRSTTRRRMPPSWTARSR